MLRYSFGDDERYIQYLKKKFEQALIDVLNQDKYKFLLEGIKGQETVIKHIYTKKKDLTEIRKAFNQIINSVKLLKEILKILALG